MTKRRSKAGKGAGSSPADAYASQVEEVLAARAAKTTVWRPEAPRSVRLDALRRRPAPHDLSPRELAQLELVWNDQLAEALQDPEHDLEVARLVGPDGAVVWHLYAWNYGVGYLFGDRGDDDLVAFGSQHDIEIWDASQREVFFAVDTALAQADPRPNQPLIFDWRDDVRWEEVGEGPSGGREFMLRHLRRRAR